jgi:N-acetylglucosamine-6-phosphate deacetylase
MGVADKKGAIEVGYDADIVIFDDAINIQSTIVNGQIVYNI